MYTFAARALKVSGTVVIGIAAGLVTLLPVSSCPAADIPAGLAAAGPAPVVGKPSPVELLEWAPHSQSIYTTDKHNGLGSWLFSVQGGFKLVGCKLYQLQHLDHHANSMAVGGNRLSSAVVLGTNVGVVELRDGQTLFPRKTYNVGQRYSIYAVAIDAAEKQIAACGTDGTVFVWNVEGEGKAPAYHLEKTSREGERMASLAFSPDSKQLAALSRYGRLTLWDLTTGQMVGKPVDSAGGEKAVLRFTPTGDRIIVVERAAIRFWHPVNEPEVRLIRPPEAVAPRYPPEEESRVGWRPDFGDGIRFAGVATLTSDATRVACILQNGGVAIWDLKTKQVQVTLPPPAITKTWEFAEEYPGMYFECIRISPDGHRVAASATTGELAVWQLP